MEKHQKFGDKKKYGPPERVVVDVEATEEGKVVKVPRFEPVYFEFPILSERGSTIESEALAFRGTHLPLNGRDRTSSKISVRGNDTVTIKCYKNKGMVLYVYEVQVTPSVTKVVCTTAQTKRKDV